MGKAVSLGKALGTLPVLPLRSVLPLVYPDLSCNLQYGAELLLLPNPVDDFLRSVQRGREEQLV